MACPFFHPLDRFQDVAWRKPPRLPLGDPCLGECRADPGAPAHPSLDELRDYCNTGYARGRCGRFPTSPDAPDAVRFSIARDAEGAIDLIYILEKDYGPVRFGPLVYDTAAATFVVHSESATLEAQARMFINSYLNRRVKA